MALHHAGWNPRPAMGFWIALCLLGILARSAAAVDTTSAPLPPEEAAQAMRLPEGFSVTLFAAEPEVVQPISFCIDDRARLFVAEALNYGAWRARGNDRVIVLEDRDGDGRAERRKVFCEGFNYITGIEVGFGGVWVLSPPTLYFVPDRDRDDQPDGPPEPIFDGFGYKESRHNLANGFSWGPDGWLYAGHGRTSPSDVGRPGEPAERRIHCDGGVYRIHPTRLVFENFADGTTNPWGVDFDDFGQCFVSNCVNPHLFHVIQGGHYEPWRNRKSSLYAYERLPTIADHLHYPTGRTSAMRGETTETLAMGGGHAHCGTLIYLGDSFPSHFRNSALMCNVHGRRINRDVLHRKGSGYVATHDRDLMIASDPWFMGVTLRTGPDGSVFVSDWSDTGECHTYQPHRETGRIYKLSFGKGRTSDAPGRRSPELDLAERSTADLIELQLHPNDWYVRHARRLLHERSCEKDWNAEESHRSLHEILAHNPDVTRRLRALWALHVTRGLNESQLHTLLQDAEPHIRAWSIQFLCESEPSAATITHLEQLARTDPSMVVRLYLASALQRLAPDQRWGIAAGLVHHAEDAEDANLPLMVWYGIEPLVSADPVRALRLNSQVEVSLVRRHLTRRFVEYQLAQPEPGDLTPWCDELLAEAREAARRDLLLGAREALRGAKELRAPSRWSATYETLSRIDDPVVRENRIELALIFGEERALQDLRRLATDVDLDPAERRRALSTLVEQRVPELVPLLWDSLDDRVLRPVALRGLASYDAPETPRQILSRYATLSAEEKQDAVATLASRKESAEALLQALEEKVVARGDISAFAARQIHALGDDPLIERLKSLWGEVRETPDHKRRLIARYRSLLTSASLQNADTENGRLLFKKNCGQCHMLFGEGGKIGPDLTGSNRANTDYLIGNLVDPGSEIGQDFRMSVIHLNDGRVITGIIVDSLPNRITVQTATERHTLARSDVEEVTESPLSMMPEGQLEQLTNSQIRDLVGFLSGQSPQVAPTKAAGQK